MDKLKKNKENSLSSEDPITSNERQARSPHHVSSSEDTLFSIKVRQAQKQASFILGSHLSTAERMLRSDLSQYKKLVKQIFKENKEIEDELR